MWYVWQRSTKSLSFCRFKNPIYCFSDIFFVMISTKCLILFTMIFWVFSNKNCRMEIMLRLRIALTPFLAQIEWASFVSHYKKKLNFLAIFVLVTKIENSKYKIIYAKLSSVSIQSSSGHRHYVFTFDGIQNPCKFLCRIVHIMRCPTFEKQSKYYMRNILNSEIIKQTNRRENYKRLHTGNAAVVLLFDGTVFCRWLRGVRFQWFRCVHWFLYTFIRTQQR